MTKRRRTPKEYTVVPPIPITATHAEMQDRLDHLNRVAARAMEEQIVVCGLPVRVVRYSVGWVKMGLGELPGVLMAIEP